MIFPDEHPFKKFEKYYYLESGAKNIQVYIFRFREDAGAIVWFVPWDKVKGPHGAVSRLIFIDDYNFDQTGDTKDIHGDSFDGVLEQLAKCLEVMKNEPLTRKDS